MAKLSTFKYKVSQIRSGTQPDSKSSEVWEEHSIEAQTAVFWYMTSPTKRYHHLLNQSFDNIESWIQEFLNQGAPKQPEKFPFILVGNKIDRTDEREVEEEAVNEFLAKHPKIQHL